MYHYFKKQLLQNFHFGLGAFTQTYTNQSDYLRETFPNVSSSVHTGVNPEISVGYYLHQLGINAHINFRPSLLQTTISRDPDQNGAV